MIKDVQTIKEFLIIFIIKVFYMTVFSTFALLSTHKN